jgi:NADPH2:quinone reductase
MNQTDTMQAVVLNGHGGVEVLELKTVPMPQPEAGEIRVRISTSGINRADLLQRLGRYPVPAGWPEDILGMECSGVMGILGGGGYAQYVTTDASCVVPIPQNLGLKEAGAIPEVFMTAFDAVVLQMSLAPKETLLIHAVGSGVGTAALQIGKVMEVKTIGTSRSMHKLDKAKAYGLDHAILADDNWSGAVLDVTDGYGADVILDLVGGPYLAGNQKAIAHKGRHVVVGVPGGVSGTIDLRAMMGKRVTLRGTVLRARSLQEKVELTESFEKDILPFLEQGSISPVVEKIFSPNEVGTAHNMMAANENFGKLLIDWE